MSQSLRTATFYCCDCTVWIASREMYDMSLDASSDLVQDIHVCIYLGISLHCFSTKFENAVRKTPPTRCLEPAAIGRQLPRFPQDKLNLTCPFICYSQALWMSVAKAAKARSASVVSCPQAIGNDLISLPWTLSSILNWACCIALETWENGNVHSWWSWVALIARSRSGHVGWSCKSWNWPCGNWCWTVAVLNVLPWQHREVITSRLWPLFAQNPMILTSSTWRSWTKKLKQSFHHSWCLAYLQPCPNCHALRMESLT